MRRFWLDELPMIINLIKGDMKMVGVRPLSKQYFSLYAEEVQQKRVMHKPDFYRRSMPICRKRWKKFKHLK